MLRMDVISTPSLGRGAIVLVAALLGACGSNAGLGGGTPDGQSPIGGAGTTGGAGTAGSVGAAGIGTAGTSPSVADGGSVAEVGGFGLPQSWTGTLEKSAFPSGSNDIKLTFATDSAGHVVGTIVFGRGTPPPPATDPNVGYPPSYHPASPFAAPFVAEGYVYSLSGTLSSNRLRFNAPPAQLWKDWCALQTSFYPEGLCLPSRGGMIDEAKKQCDTYLPKKGTWTEVDCDKLALCSTTTICECDAKSCHASSEGGVLFDVLITGSTANGSAIGTVSGNVHFTRDP